MVLWRPTRPSRTNTPPKNVLLIIGDWNAKVGSQKIPRVTGKFGLGIQTKVGQRLTEFCQENALVIANTLFLQHKRGLYAWTSPDGQHWNQMDYILCSQKWRNSTQAAKTRPGADCGSDHEHVIARFRLKLKKVGKTTRPFRYDLNQNPYDYRVEWQILKGDAVEVLHSNASKFGKLSSGHRTGKGQFSFQSQGKAMPKNAQTTTQLHSSHPLAK